MAKECEDRVLEAYKAGDAEEAFVHFHRFRSMGVLPTTETWHKILLLSYRDGNYYDIESLFHTLISFGVTPDVVAWNFLLDLVSKRGLVRKSEEIFWQAVKYTNGQINETTFQLLFNVLMQEKRYLRAMVILAGMKQNGVSISEEQNKILQDFSQKHIQEQPGAFKPLRVPSVDVERVSAALDADEASFSNSNLLSIADYLSPEGQKAVLDWHNDRIKNVTPEAAFKFVMRTAAQAWDHNFSEAFGVDQLRTQVLKAIVSQPSDTITLEENLSRLVDAQIERTKVSTFPVGSLSLEEDKKSVQHIFISQTEVKNTYKRKILDYRGQPITNPNLQAQLSQAPITSASVAPL